MRELSLIAVIKSSLLLKTLVGKWRNSGMLRFGKRRFLNLLLACIIFLPVVSGCTRGVNMSYDPVYWVAGRIVDAGGRGIEGVRLIASTPTLQIATTDSDGQWMMTGLIGAVRITPVKEGRVFQPTSKMVSGNSTNVDWNHSFTSIRGEPVVPLVIARLWLKEKAPDWVDVADLYYSIAPDYGIRPDVALAQACKETGYFRFNGLVKAWQNNVCGLGATGVPCDGNTPLNGADPTRVNFQKGVHGAIFVDLATGVEAHIQHLYAYACTDPLPEGKVLLSPRFNFVRRGSARYVEHLGARENPLGVGWAYPGDNYGKEIVWNYLEDMISLIAATR